MKIQKVISIVYILYSFIFTNFCVIFISVPDSQLIELHVSDNFKNLLDQGIYLFVVLIFNFNFLIISFYCIDLIEGMDGIDLSGSE